MPARTPLKNRPWYNTTLYDTLTRDSIIHFDAFAVRDQHGHIGFYVEYLQGGKSLQAANAYVFDTAGQLVPIQTEAIARMRQCEPLYWTRDTMGIFAPAHPAMVKLSRHPVPGMRTLAHFHYIRVPDLDPFPATMVNGYTYKRRDMAVDPLIGILD